MKNKKFSVLRIFKIMVIFCISSFVTDIHAQYSMGVRAGLNNSWRARRTFVDKDEYIHRSGFALSFLTYVDIGKTLGIGVEPGMVQRVTSSTFFQFEGPSFENKIRLNYFELPVFISARCPLWNDRLKMNVKAGYGISSITGAKSEIQTGIPGVIPFTEPFPINEFSAMNSFDHGIYSGIGIEYKIGKQNLIIESMYYMGMNNVTLFDVAKNRSLHLGIGYMIDF